MQNELLELKKRVAVLESMLGVSEAAIDTFTKTHASKRYNKEQAHNIFTSTKDIAVKMFGDVNNSRVPDKVSNTAHIEKSIKEYLSKFNPTGVPYYKHVDEMANLMKDKLDNSGKHGWETCPAIDLHKGLIQACIESDYVSICNYAAMLHARGQK